jgi:hypothetical protein
MPADFLEYGLAGYFDAVAEPGHDSYLSTDEVLAIAELEDVSLVVVRESPGHDFYECDGKTVDTGGAPTIIRLIHDGGSGHGGHFERLIPLATYEAAEKEAKRRGADAKREALRCQREAKRRRSEALHAAVQTEGYDVEPSSKRVRLGMLPVDYYSEFPDEYPSEFVGVTCQPCGEEPEHPQKPWRRKIMASPSVSSASEDDTDESDGFDSEMKPTLEVRAREVHHKVTEQDDWRRRCEILATTHLRNLSNAPTGLARPCQILEGRKCRRATSMLLLPVQEMPLHH